MKTIKGAGLGLRREMLDELLPVLPDEVDFWEVAPENWIPLGGKFNEDFERCARQAQLSTHGLSLSIGGPDPLDHRFLKAVKHFLDRYNIPLYSEHLSYCGAQGHMYDLMPIPFTEEAVRYVADRVNVVQDIIERPLVLENVSYYLTAHAQMTELEFINAVLSESGCSLLLDVNNVYVNSINHRYDPKSFIDGLPGNKIVYGHIAGHYEEAEDLRVDTHGADVIEEVWALLAYAYRQHHVFPTLLERDFNIPPLETLLQEVRRIKSIQQQVMNEQVGVAQLRLTEQLTEFATAIRFPEQTSEQDQDTQRRLSIYQSLFFNNVEGFIRNGFPVLHSLYGSDNWQQLVRTFFQQHPCRSPYFIDISKEFVEFLSNAYEPTLSDPVFLKELAHYEWLELALSVRKTDSPVTYWRGETIPDYVRSSPLSELAGYAYPVHMIGPDFQPEAPGEQHFYLLYRDSEHHVGFQHLNPLAALTFDLLNQQPTSVERLCERVHQQAAGLPLNTVQQGVHQLVSQWLTCGAVTEA